jgi:hypothetical protein
MLQNPSFEPILEINHQVEKVNNPHENLDIDYQNEGQELTLSIRTKQPYLTAKESLEELDKTGSRTKCTREFCLLYNAC